MDERWMMSRRALLGGIGAMGALGALRIEHAQAQAIAPRLIVVHVPEGMWSGAPRPAVGTTNLGPIFAELQDKQSRVLVLNNLDMKSRDHGPGGDGHHRGVPHMFTGTEMLDDANAGGPSVDQVIARSIGTDSRFASLHFAVRIVYGDTNARCLWSGPGRVVPAMQDPWDAYARVFRDVMPAGPSQGAAPADLRRSALDHSLAEIATLRARLPVADRALLDSYQDSLRDIERRLMANPAPTADSGCTLPQTGPPLDPKAESNYPTVGRLQMDLMVSALQCGLTRVATLQWGNSNDQCSYSFLGINALGHDLAHNNNNVDPDGSKKLKVFQWYAKQARYLVDKLESIPEGSGTMLDNTLILWASEFSESNGHNANRLLWLLMGNAGGQINSGRIVDCGGRSTNDLHTSLCQAYGLSNQTFGNPAYCDGPLPHVT